MFQRFAAARLMPALLAVLVFAGAVQAQKASDTDGVVYAPQPAPNAQSTPDSFVGYRLFLADNLWFQPHVFVCGGIDSARTWHENKGQIENDGYWSKGYFLRNGRIALDGQITKYFSVFYQSDDLSVNGEYNGGFKNTYGKKSNALYIKDAYLHFQPMTAFQLYAGLLTVPATRANLISDAGLLGTENTSMSPQFGSYSHSGRDTGIMVRGLLFKSIMEYRFGVYRGLSKETITNSDGSTTVRNKDNSLRYTGRIQLNAGDAEDSYFYSENYLSKRFIFGIGFGLDYQAHIYHSTSDYFAWGVDLPVNVAMSPMYVITGQFNMTLANNYPDSTGVLYNGFFCLNLQAGMLMAETIEPIFKYTYTTTGGNKLEYKTFTVGCNYYIDGNRTNFKSSISVPIGKNKHYPDQWKMEIQFQEYF